MRHPSDARIPDQLCSCDARLPASGFRYRHPPREADAQRGATRARSASGGAHEPRPALAVVVATAALTTAGLTGIAEARPDDQAPPDVVSVCVKNGGTIMTGPGAWICSLPDGRTIFCFPDGSPRCYLTRGGGEWTPFQPASEGVYDDSQSGTKPRLPAGCPTGGVDSG